MDEETKLTPDPDQPAENPDEAAAASDSNEAETQPESADSSAPAEEAAQVDAVPDADESADIEPADSAADDELDVPDADATEAEADDADDNEDDYEDDYDELDTTLEEDEIATSPLPPVDWAALASAGAGIGSSDVPDLTAAGETPMDVDIDAALAAVDTLGAVVAAEQERKREEADRREAQRRADEEYRRWAESYVFRRPGMIRVQGGRIVTILPAVALMAVGAVLTLATASGQAMAWQTLVAAASAGLSVSLLSYWLASGRWARGALFAALLIGIGGGWIFAQTLPAITLSWRVPFIALGAAFALTGLLGRPRSTIWLMTGAGIVAGAAILPFLSQAFLTRAAPFVLAAAVILAALPAVLRVRRS